MASASIVKTRTNALRVNVATDVIGGHDQPAGRSIPDRRRPVASTAAGSSARV